MMHISRGYINKVAVNNQSCKFEIQCKDHWPYTIVLTGSMEEKWQYAHHWTKQCTTNI